MTELRTLLQTADPFHHEVPRLDAERERIRVAMLRAMPGERSTSVMRARLTLVAVLSLGVLSVVALGYQLWLHGATRVLAAVRFEVRLAEDRPIPGLVVGQVAGSGRVIYLHPEIVISNEDVARSWVVPQDADEYGVGVQLLPGGAERIKQATATHVGRPMAILIDGSVVMAPVVRSPMSDSAVITGHFTQAEAERLAAGIVP